MDWFIRPAVIVVAIIGIEVQIIMNDRMGVEIAEAC